MFQTERYYCLVLRVKIKIADIKYYAKYFTDIISVYEPGIIIILVSQPQKEGTRC